LDCGYRLDLLVESKVVVEIKAVEKILPIHKAPLLTYLKIGGWKGGFLINFNIPLLKFGIDRIVYGLEEPKNSSLLSNNSTTTNISP
jgi:GxxExxY protein